MNAFPLWKYLLVAIVLTVGAVYALPNVYGDDPAIQVSQRRAAPVDEALRDKLQEAVQAVGVSWKSAAFEQGSLLIRFNNVEDRATAQPIIEEALGTQFVAALNLAPATPAWLRAIGAKPMYMGLDLRGGVHFLMEVDVAAVERQSGERFESELRTALREADIRYRTINADTRGNLTIEFLDAAAREAGAALIYADYRDLIEKDADPSAPAKLELSVRPEYLATLRDSALDQNLVTLNNRVNEFGVAEPVIQKQGDTRIVVQLPGVQDTARAKEILGSTATLEFRMVDTTNNVQDALDGRVPVSSALYHERNGNPVLLSRRVMLTGDSITDASSGFEQQTGAPAVFITLDGEGARRFSRATRDEIGKPMAVVFIEQQRGRPVAEVINIATIRDQLGQRFQITGLDTGEEARTLALLLRAGALAAPMEIVEERTVGPSMGAENIAQGLRSVLIGFLVVSVFIAIYYKVFGLIADLGLAVNVVLLVALMSMLQATLTLPGIAGILLTVGMAIDANVLINERIREELRNGSTPHASIFAGYDKAWGTIADSNITTLIAAVVLFMFGSGPVKGFAVTLSLGILTSMFSAVLVTRAIVSLVYGRRRVATLAI